MIIHRLCVDGEGDGAGFGESWGGTAAGVYCHHNPTLSPNIGNDSTGHVYRALSHILLVMNSGKPTENKI
jgi:hypothetical protein